MASASRRGEGICSWRESESMIDLFSTLPDQISHHILCLLAVTDLARFGCVSKRCRELCLSSPKLNLDEFSLVNTSTCYKRLELFTYLDRFFVHRGDNKIQSFRLRWYRHDVCEGEDEEAQCVCDCCASFRLFTWIENAVRCNVEVLDLAMNYRDEEERFLFPASVFLCGTLRHLILHLNCTVLKTPSFAFQSNLKILELKNVDIDDGGGFFKWISCCCKFIEELSLEHVCVTQEITVESSSLKILNCSGIFLIDKCHINISCEKLEYIRICWVFDSPRNKSLNMFAPNLKSFKWFGSLMNHSNLGKLEHLEVAAFFLEPTFDILDNIVEVLHSLCRAKLFMLNEATIKALPLKELSSRPAPLCDTSSLCIEIGSFIDELIPAMVSLFRAMPKLCTLCVMLNPPSGDPNSNASGISVEYWKLQNLAFVYQLKHVTIELCHGSNGMELARYIIEYAQNLQKMVIVYSSQDLEKITRELEKSKMIPNATIDFQEKSTKRLGFIFSVLSLLALDNQCADMVAACAGGEVVAGVVVKIAREADKPMIQDSWTMSIYIFL